MITKYFDLITQSVNALSQGNLLALAALFLMLALTEIGIPFPFAVQGILFFVGFQLTRNAISVVPVLLILVGGRQFGSAVVYWLARILDTTFTGWFERRFRGAKLDRLKIKLHRRAPLAVAIGRLTPGLLVPTSLASGAMRLRYGHFAMGIALSALVWDGTFIGSAVLFKNGANQLGLSTGPGLVLGILTTVATLAWLLPLFLARRKPVTVADKDG